MANKTQHIAEILGETEAALEEVYHYYKFARHKNGSPERPYLLLSHCAHLLFSLWLAEEDGQADIFNKDARLAALLAGLDFGSMRYADYTRRMLYADAFEEHLKNEPKWFKFWMRVLERVGASGGSGFQEFSQRILAHVGHHGFLEGRMAKKNKKALDTLIKTDEIGRLIFRSTCVLENMTSAVASHFARLDPRTHILEQVLSLICSLSQIRRTIVFETPAKGPYTLRADKRWGTPSLLTRLTCGRTEGVLRVVPRREGGSIACTYRWTSDSKRKTRSWVLDSSALTGGYEEELFKTWAYDTGEYLRGPERSSDMRACWTVQSVEAGHIEAVTWQIDRVLETLSAYPAWSGLVEEVATTSRTGRGNWKAGELPWTYIKTLDQLVAKLRFVCREAKVLGGENPAEKVIADLWPPHQLPAERADTRDPQGPSSRHARVLGPSIHAHNTSPGPETGTNRTGVNQPATTMEPEGKPEPCGTYDRSKRPEFASRTVATEHAPGEQETIGTPRTTDESVAGGERKKVRTRVPRRKRVSPESVSGQVREDRAVEERELRTDLPNEVQPSRTGSPQESELPGSGDQAKQSDAASQQAHRKQRTKKQTTTASVLSSEHTGNEEAAAPAPLAEGERARQTVPRFLLERLLRQHRLPTGEGNYAPLSSKQLQCDLGWSQSKVRKAMQDIFGKQPFTIYKQKCSDKTICHLLEDLDNDQASASGAEAQTRCLSVV